MFDLFWDQFGFPGSESIFGNLVLLGFHVGSSGTPFWKPRKLQRIDFEDLGLTPGSIFGDSEAPGHAPGGSLRSKGGLDRFWERFWEPNGRPREPKCLPKSI